VPSRALLASTSIARNVLFGHLDLKATFQPPQGSRHPFSWQNNSARDIEALQHPEELWQLFVKFLQPSLLQRPCGPSLEYPSSPETQTEAIFSNLSLGREIAAISSDFTSGYFRLHFTLK